MMLLVIKTEEIQLKSLVKAKKLYEPWLEDELKCVIIMSNQWT